MPETQQLILGSPSVGTPRMPAAPDLAIDLPTCLLVSSAPRVSIVVHDDPLSVAARHGIDATRPAGFQGITSLVDPALGGGIES
jgi:uncharacterized protein (DUF302 family)